jgi:hypothetical protein
MRKSLPGDRRLGAVALLAAAIVLGGRPDAGANSTGIIYQAEEGCTCHGIVGDVPTTRVFIVGLPDGSNPTVPAGYVPGEAYDIQVVTLGVAGGAPAAGYNLEPTAGDLATPDTDSRIVRDDECQKMSRDTGCTRGLAANDCTIVVNANCPAGAWDLTNPDCDKCPRNSTETCRPCDASIILSVQATHSHPKAPPFIWNLRWTAPPAGSGPVTFFLAANVVNGNGSNDATDLWSRLGSDPLQPIITVPEGGQAAASALAAH